MAKSKPKPPSPFVGRWRIVSMSGWDNIYFNDSAAFVEWTFDGDHDITSAEGKGWAVLVDGEIHGMIFFVQGGEFDFVANFVAMKA